MTGDGGLIALSLDDAQMILEWASIHDPSFTCERPGCHDLTQRISEWIGRHSEATP